MQNKTNKSFKFSAVLLALALLFPFTSQAIHFISHHDHEQCTDQSIAHYHKHNFECEIFDFQLSSITTFSSNENKEFIDNNYELSFPQLEVVFINFNTSKISLRGPPTK